MSAPSEIDKAISLLSALKSARPAAFDDAMARLAQAPGPSGANPLGEGGQSASALALGLLKGAFSAEAAQMLLELAPQLPKLEGGALGVAARPGPPSSLASKAIRQGLDTPWARFVAQAICDGAMPLDAECALDVACRLEDAFDDSEERPSWAGRPDLFHEALGAIVDWRVDWREIQAQTGFDFVPWILERWLHEGGPDAHASALGACRRLFEAGACKDLPAGAWLEFARPPRPELLPQSLAAMRQCLPFCAAALAEMGESPCGFFCKRAFPTPFMGAALRACLEADPHGPFLVAPDGSCCMSWLNERLGQPGGAQWRSALLECFEILIERGADPRWIAPRVSPSALAKDPKVAAAIEAADIAEQAQAGTAAARGAL